VKLANEKVGDRFQPSAAPRRPGLADVGTVPDLVLTPRTDARFVDPVGGEYPSIVCRDECTAVLAFRHTFAD
jgi:hypothetical protein